MVLAQSVIAEAIRHLRRGFGKVPPLSDREIDTLLATLLQHRWIPDTLLQFIVTSNGKDYPDHCGIAVVPPSQFLRHIASYYGGVSWHLLMPHLTRGRRLSPNAYNPPPSYASLTIGSAEYPIASLP